LTSPVLSHNYIVLADADGYLYWLRSTDGSIVAKRRINRKGFYSAPVTFDDGLIIYASDGKLHTINYQ
jgi:outer membrane protein assembly factor BamB